MLAITVAGCCRTVAQSVEGTPPAPERPDSGADRQAAPMDGARKDFEAVKSLRDFGGEPKGGMSGVAVPSLQTGAALALPIGSPKKSDGGKQSANWLADAMGKHPPARNPRGSAGRVPEKDGEQAENREPPAKPGGEYDRNDRSKPINPFSAYLGAWMTPQDFALLKPALEHSYSGESGRSKISPLNPAGDAAPSRPDGGPIRQDGGLVPLSRDSIPARRNNVPGAARENPYLDVLGSSLSISSPTALAPKPNQPVVVPAPAGSPPPEPLAAPTVPRSKIPEFVRPNTDEKYFKQLKRF